VQFVLRYTKGGGSSTESLINRFKPKQNPWGWKPQNYSGTGRDPITNCEKGNESFWGYKEEVKNILEKTVPCPNYNRFL